MEPRTYAFVKNNVVVNTAIFEDPTQELLGIFKSQNELDHILVVEDSTEVGDEYDNGHVWPSKPYPSWVKNYDQNVWEAPVPKPDDGKEYFWDESFLEWHEALVLE